MVQLFNRHTQEDHANTLAHYLPNGKLFTAKWISTSNFRKLLNGIALEMQRAESQLAFLQNEVDPRTTTQLIEEWESNVGIPDDCFTVATDIADRRNNVVIKLASLGVQNEQDFIDLADLLGYTITISQPTTAVYPAYDVPFTPTSSKADKFTWIVTGTGVEGSIIECLFDKLKPANTLVTYTNL